MSSSSVKMCLGYSSSFSACSEGITSKMNCSNRKMSFNFLGGIYNQLYGSSGYTINSTINYDCPFTSAIMNYYSCPGGDGLGTSCTCCSTTTFEGLVSSYGTCVPSNSPIVQAKSAMKSNYGFQHLFSLILVLFQIVLILI